MNPLDVVLTSDATSVVSPFTLHAMLCRCGNQTQMHTTTTTGAQVEQVQIVLFHPDAVHSLYSSSLDETVRDHFCNTAFHLKHGVRPAANPTSPATTRPEHHTHHTHHAHHTPRTTRTTHHAPRTPRTTRAVCLNQAVTRVNPHRRSTQNRMPSDRPTPPSICCERKTSSKPCRRQTIPNLYQKKTVNVCKRCMIGQDACKMNGLAQCLKASERTRDGDKGAVAN